MMLPGCGGATREDRTITFSATGGSVGFQHGREGVFVADKDGGGLTKIFTPDENVIAVGTPLWAPNDKRLIFTTARTPDNARRPVLFAGTEDDPAGRVFLEQPAVYTCWLREEPKGDADPEPRELFTAEVGFVGYVAAGLAVRWHPDGNRVLYVKQVGNGHAVFEFDLAGKTSRRVFPARDTDAAVLFDWSPDGTRLACLLAGTPDRKDDGIWVGRDGADWWHIPESRDLARGEWPAALEALKATRPAWTKDGRRFVFAASCGGKPDEPVPHALRLADVDGRRVERLLEGQGPMRELAWSPDGERFGFVSEGDGRGLRVRGPKGDVVTVAAKPVRTFAGWDAPGRHLAYTTADDIPLKDEAGFSLLFFADPLARDSLWVAPGDGTGPGRAVVSGLRTTFARWSPTEEKLSLWFTFCPTHGSIFSRGLGWGLRPGDPAAVIDAKTGNISWMAVNANEKAQVGHYHLLKRDYAAAWAWYEQARRDRAEHPEPQGQHSEWDALRARPFRDVSFFEYYCLDKMGRHEEARVKLAEFREQARRLLPSDEELSAFPLRMGNDEAKFTQWLRGEVQSLVPMARDFYAAEVFLSLDAAADAEAYFRSALAEAANDDDRLSAAVVLSQLLLLEGRADDYLAVVIDSVAPLALKSLKAAGQGAAGDTLNPPVPVSLAGLSIVPLLADDFLGRLSNRSVERWTAFCGAFREQARHDALRLLADAMLEGVHRRLGNQAAAQAARQRQRANPCFGKGAWAGANALKWDSGPRANAQFRETAGRFGLMGMLTLRAMARFSEPDQGR
jgi:hypothetical protein